MLLAEQLAKSAGNARRIMRELAPGEADDVVAEEFELDVSLSVPLERGAGAV
jgi:hypothetical protein